jgi:hypothetical protein
MVKNMECQAVLECPLYVHTMISMQIEEAKINPYGFSQKMQRNNPRWRQKGAILFMRISV